MYVYWSHFLSSKSKKSVASAAGSLWFSMLTSAPSLCYWPNTSGVTMGSTGRQRLQAFYCAFKVSKLHVLSWHLFWRRLSQTEPICSQDHKSDDNLSLQTFQQTIGHQTRDPSRAEKLIHATKHRVLTRMYKEVEQLLTFSASSPHWWVYLTLGRGYMYDYDVAAYKISAQCH